MKRLVCRDPFANPAVLEWVDEPEELVDVNQLIDAYFERYRIDFPDPPQLISSRHFNTLWDKSVPDMSKRVQRLHSVQTALGWALKEIRKPPPKPVENNAMGHVLSETLAQKHGMYPDEFRTAEGRQRVLEQIAIALIDARVDGKMINTTPGVHRFVEAYRDVEKLLSQGVDHG